MDDKKYIEETDVNQGVPLGSGLIPTPTYITLPISLPGTKLNDSQTVQIQVLNPNLLQQHNYQQKIQLGQIHIPIPSYHTNTTVLTVAYNNEEGEILRQNGFAEDMTVLAAIQPQDLQSSEIQTSAMFVEDTNKTKSSTKRKKTRVRKRAEKEGSKTQQAQHQDSLMIDNNNAESLFETDKNHEQLSFNKSVKTTKQSKEKTSQKTGLVHIATALDGTTLYCCPECQMAYSEKACLENHLSLHKIERRFICDICGTGLKRKEHLERHKLGHQPARPFSCNICGKGFKRKEHLNLHVVIHSGIKTEICDECGKGFYRKDHLRKHIKSHISKRLKEQTPYICYTDMSNNSMRPETSYQFLNEKPAMKMENVDK